MRDKNGTRVVQGTTLVNEKNGHYTAQVLRIDHRGDEDVAVLGVEMTQRTTVGRVLHARLSASALVLSSWTSQ